MPKHLWTICCENIIVDSLTNTISLIHVVQQLNVRANAPAMVLRLFVVSLWAREGDEAETFKYRLVWRAPESDDVTPWPEIEVEIPSDKDRARSFVEFHKLPFHGEGSYRFLIEIQDAEGNWEPVHELPIRVIEKTN